MTKVKTHWLFLITLITFLSLAYKSPFSERTLVPNFEPYPDTFNYLTAAQCMIKGQGRTLCRGDELKLTPNVPPLYTYSIIPILLIKNDVRMVYYLNILLSISAFYIFYLIIKKLIQNPLIIALSLFLYATNYHLYWQPSLAMAENLLLPIFLSLVYLLIKPVSKKHIFVATILSLALYGTKYIAAPMSMVFCLLFLYKIIFTPVEKTKNNKKQLFLPQGTLSRLTAIHLVIYCLGILTGLISFEAYKIIFKAYHFLSSLVFNIGKPVGSAASTPNSFKWYSLSYIPKNLPIYLKSITGQSVRFLWHYAPLLPGFVAKLGLLGIVIQIRNQDELRNKKKFSGAKKAKFFSLSIIAIMAISILFTSTFYPVESRYIYFLIPILILGFAFFLQELSQLLLKVKFPFIKKYAFTLILIITGLWYVSQNILGWKNQVVLNLKYAETPWYYITVKENHNFFSQQNLEKKPYLISALTPYFYDFYTQNQFTLIPLTPAQDFFHQPKDVWGDYDYSDLIKLYEQLINEGNSLYLTNYGLGNEQRKHNDFQKIKDHFELEKVHTACHDACNIYLVKRIFN